jgi:internalin A
MITKKKLILIVIVTIFVVLFAVHLLISPFVINIAGQNYFTFKICLELNVEENSDIESLKYMKLLKHLVISDGIPNEELNINSIGELTQLTSLELLRTQTKDFSPLSKLTNLKKLYIAGYYLENLDFAVSMGSLSEITLCLVLINDISGISNLQSLEKIVLAETYYISDIAPLKNLTNLKKLTIWNTNVTDISALSGLTNLEVLELVGGKNITNIEYLENLTNVEYLNLNYNPITDITPLKNMTKLEVLSIHGTNITDISILFELKNLKKIYIDKGQLSDEDISLLKSNGVEILNEQYDYYDN